MAAAVYPQLMHSDHCGKFAMQSVALAPTLIWVVQDLTQFQMSTPMSQAVMTTTIQQHGFYCDACSSSSAIQLRQHQYDYFTQVFTANLLLNRHL